MTDLEALSRLLDGDLPPAEAEALRARIAAEPALAASWSTLQALPDDLLSLADVTPPPVEPPAPRRANNTPAWIAAAAALILLALWARPRPEPVLLHGEQLVEGTLTVLAGDTRVAVNGRALISVEPPEGFAREELRTPENPMNRSHLAAALAGALVTVAVYEGSAVVTPATAEPVHVQAGETTSVGNPATPQRRVVVQRAPGAATTSELSELDALREENHALKSQLAASRFGGQLANARVELHEGKPLPWPEDVPASWQPDAFTASIEAAMAAADIAGFPLDIDCSEYPCLALIESSQLEDPPDDLWERIVDSMKSSLGEDVRAGIQASTIGDQNGNRSFGALSFFPNDQPQEGVRERLNYRGESMIQDAVEEGAEPTEEDVDVTD